MADMEPAPLTGSSEPEDGPDRTSRGERLTPARASGGEVSTHPTAPAPEGGPAAPAKEKAEPREKAEPKEKESKENREPKEAAPVAPEAPDSEVQPLPISIARLVPKLKKSARLFEEGKKHIPNSSSSLIRVALV